jgi:hypothetical protein
MFPEVKFEVMEERNDCFYADAPQFEDGVRKKYFAIQEVKKGLFIEPNREDFLIVVRWGDFLNGIPSFCHAMGFYHAFLGVFDKKNKKLLAMSDELIGYSGGKIAIYEGKDKAFILFLDNQSHQGFYSSSIQFLFVNNRRFEKMPLREWIELEVFIEWPEIKKQYIKEIAKDKDLVDMIGISGIEESLDIFIEDEEIIYAPEIAVYPDKLSFFGVGFSDSFRIHLFDFYWNKEKCKFELNSTSPLKWGKASKLRKFDF